MNTEQQEQQIPAGYMQNPLGHLVPINTIAEQDLLRDQLVKELVAKAKTINTELAAFKNKALQDIEDLVAISGERYDVFLGGNKGNVVLYSFDGGLKVQRVYREIITYTEEILAAKQLIENCLVRWSDGANTNLQAMVSQAFRVNGQGEIKIGKVLELLRLEIEDKEWANAMHALRDALQVAGTTVYVRIYERIGKTDQWKPISLDLAAV
jgi:hypothetical protein